MRQCVMGDKSRAVEPIAPTLRRAGPSASGYESRGVPSSWERWIPALTDSGSAIDLICLPHAGGGPSQFLPWVDLAPRGVVRLRAVALPGRESRFGELPVEDFADAVDAIERQLLAMESSTVALFGHCLGGKLALALAQRLEQRGRGVRHLFVSDLKPPRTGEAPPPVSELPRFELYEYVKGLPDEIAQSPEMLDLLEPIFRGDFKLNETARLDQDVPIRAPITVFSSDEDSAAAMACLRGWERFTNASLTLDCQPGPHWPTGERWREIGATVCRALSAFEDQRCTEEPTPQRPHTTTIAEGMPDGRA